MRLFILIFANDKMKLHGFYSSLFYYPTGIFQLVNFLQTNRLRANENKIYLYTFIEIGLFFFILYYFFSAHSFGSFFFWTNKHNVLTIRQQFCHKIRKIALILVTITKTKKNGCWLKCNDKYGIFVSDNFSRILILNLLEISIGCMCVFLF